MCTRYHRYYGPATLSARWLYPTAGPKPGGTRVTIYGTGPKLRLTQCIHNYMHNTCTMHIHACTRAMQHFALAEGLLRGC